MGFISHYWPGITPFNVEDIALAWWAYYVNEAKAIVKERQRQAREANRGRR